MAARPPAATASAAGTAATLQPRLLSGYLSAIRPATTSNSAAASASLSPGASRPITLNRRSARERSSEGSNARGFHRATEPSLGKRKSAGITPTISCGAPSSVIVRPIARGSPPSRPRQNAWLSTTTRSRPEISSSGRNPRPRAGVTPSRPNRLADARTEVSSSGSPSPVSANPHEAHAAIASSFRDSRRQSRKFAADTRSRSFPDDGCRSHSISRRSAVGYASGRNSAASARLKKAVFAPMPSASVSTAASVKPGLRLRRRTASRRSAPQAPITRS